jgi:hypothetical protein
VGKAAHLVEKKIVCAILAAKSEEKRELGRPVYRWEYNVKRFFSGWVSEDSILLAQGRDN